MSAFDLPKTPGGTNFSTIDRFKEPKSRSPGPLAYEHEATINFSNSNMSRSSSSPAFAFRGRYELPGERQRSRDLARMTTPLRVQDSVGETQVSSARRTAPNFSMAANIKHGVTRGIPCAASPSPLSYTLPRARVYETRADRSFGTESRFGSEGNGTSLLHPRRALQSPGPSIDYPSDAAVRSDTHTLVSHAFPGRNEPRRPNVRSPGPLMSGDGFSTKSKVLRESPSYSMGKRPENVLSSQRGPGPVRYQQRLPLEPSPETYQARSLYWSGKKPLGRSGTAPGMSRSASALSIHKDVQASQPALELPRLSGGA